MAIDIDDVLTHDELDEFLGGQLTQQQALLPPSWSGDSAPARKHALARVLRELERRRPPVFESEITELEDIKHAVLYAAAAHLYRLNITEGGDTPVFAVQAKNFEQLFRGEMDSMQITVPGGEEVASAGIAVVRR